MTEAFPFPDLSPDFLAPINAIPGIRAGWVERIPGLSITGDRDEAMRWLRPHHSEAVSKFSSLSGSSWWRAEQVHGTEVALVPGSPIIEADDGLPVVPGADGLITATVGVILAIYTADCGPIWLADQVTGAIGLLHSGKKGTEENILAAGLERMKVEFGTNANDVTVVLGPCIRPPDYETDFAAEIGRQAARAGIGEFQDCLLNTANDLKRFYSYRRELGKTGRMMALLTRTQTS